MGDVESSPVETVESTSDSSSLNSNGGGGSDRLKRKGTVVEKGTKDQSSHERDKGGGGGCKEKQVDSSTTVGTSASAGGVKEMDASASEKLKLEVPNDNTKNEEQKQEIQNDNTDTNKEKEEREKLNTDSTCVEEGNQKERLELAEALRELSAVLGEDTDNDERVNNSIKGQGQVDESGGGGEEDESVFEMMPDGYKGMMMMGGGGGGLPLRTIPFRSASFSQVDITSEGKYIRNPRSPITLKPTAFCLLNNSYASGGASTLPRTHHNHKEPTCNNATNTTNTCTNPISFTSNDINTSQLNEFDLNAAVSGREQLIGKEDNLSITVDLKEDNNKTNELIGGVELSVPDPYSFNRALVEGLALPGGTSSPASSTILETLVETEVEASMSEVGNSSCGEGDRGEGHSSKVVFEVGDPDYQDPAMDDTTAVIPQQGLPEDEKGSGDAEGDKSDCGTVGNAEAEVPMGDFENFEPKGETEGSNKPKVEPVPVVVSVDEVDNNGENIEGEEKGNETQLFGICNQKPPLIVREDSLITRSSSEEGPKSDDPDEQYQTPMWKAGHGSQGLSKASEKAKKAFKLGLQAKLPLLDLDACGGCGGGSSVSGSGGEEDPSGDKFSLYRQSSGQSDASDELTQGQGGQLSDPCSSPPTLRNNSLSAINSSATPLTAALALDSSLKRSTMTTAITTGAYSAPTFSGSFASSPPSSISSYSRHRGETPGSPTLEGGGTSDFSRANSVSSVSGGVGRQLPPRRYYKRPLRGPYGEMLEAEMNKVISSRRNRDYDSLEFFRESKSSSPSRSPPNDPLLLGATGSPKLSNTLLMASMDDLNLTKQSKHPNPRCRKISTNLPAAPSPHYHSGEEGGVLTYHQRTASSPSQLLYTSSVDQGSNKQRPNLDASPRGHVLAELVETEKSYVDSLRILVKKYMDPLKAANVIDAGLIDEIFFQIPAILWHHQRLLDFLQLRVVDDTQCVGDVLLDTFRQNSLLECYSLFVSNWKNAKGSLKMAVASKLSLARFLDANARQHKGKLSVDSLLIMPIQRIPRYELLVKELLKHTDPTHEDHSRLMLVLEKIKKFAVHIDCASVDPNDNREIEIEGWTAGLGHLVRQDVVTLCTSANVRKERALFLFADSIVTASIKRKSTMRKTSSNQSQNPGGNLESCKFKLLMKVPLTDIHILGEDLDGFAGKNCGGPHGSSSHSEEMDDLKTIHKMMELATLLKCPHVGLDDVLRELAAGLKHQCDNSADAVEFEIRPSDSSDSTDVFKILFGSAEKKNSWLNSFQETLGKFIRYGFGKTPQLQFLQALPIRKTRAGLILSGAAPVSLQQNKSGKSTCEINDVWVANSDGYVGQICILTLHPEPSITSCNGVCNSRITCILSVPPPHHVQQPAHHGSAGMGSSSQPSDSSEPTLPYHRYQQQNHPYQSLGDDSEDDGQRNGKANKSTEHWSVWLGTEDGSLHVYDCSDSVRVKKNKHKVQHKAPLNCMVYYDCRVFVALGNGDIAVYCRNSHGKGGWSVNEPSWVTIGSGINPVTKMICVGTSLWCVSGSQIKVYGQNSGMLELLRTIQVNADNECGNQMPRGITNLTATEEHVWVAVQGSSIVKCYSNISYEILFEADVAPEVSKILTGCDDIIRQHKSACLRVTAILVAPDKTLWVGTSAGVILTLTSAGPNHKITPLCQGHTGQVRLLTCCVTKDSSIIISGGDGSEEFKPVNPPMNNNNGASFSSVVSSLVGETSVDLSGREDSTNHLLIWKVPRLP